MADYGALAGAAQSAYEGIRTGFDIYNKVQDRKLEREKYETQKGLSFRQQAMAEEEHAAKIPGLKFASKQAETAMRIQGSIDDELAARDKTLERIKSQSDNNNAVMGLGKMIQDLSTDTEETLIQAGLAAKADFVPLKDGGHALKVTTPLGTVMTLTPDDVDAYVKTAAYNQSLLDAQVAKHDKRLESLYKDLGYATGTLKPMSETDIENAEIKREKNEIEKAKLGITGKGRTSEDFANAAEAKRIAEEKAKWREEAKALGKSAAESTDKKNQSRLLSGQIQALVRAGDPDDIEQARMKFINLVRSTPEKEILVTHWFKENEKNLALEDLREAAAAFNDFKPISNDKFKKVIEAINVDPDADIKELLGKKDKQTSSDEDNMNITVSNKDKGITAATSPVNVPTTPTNAPTGLTTPTSSNAPSASKPKRANEDVVSYALRKGGKPGDVVVTFKDGHTQVLNYDKANLEKVKRSKLFIAQ